MLRCSHTSWPQDRDRGHDSSKHREENKAPSSSFSNTWFKTMRDRSRKIHLIMIGRFMIAGGYFSQCIRLHVSRRIFLLPSIKVRLFNDPILLPWSWVEDVGLAGLDVSLPVWEPWEDWEADLLRPSSARMSSRETLRWGCV